MLRFDEQLTRDQQVIDERLEVLRAILSIVGVRCATHRRT